MALWIDVDFGWPKPPSIQPAPPVKKVFFPPETEPADKYRPAYGRYRNAPSVSPFGPQPKTGPILPQSPSDWITAGPEKPFVSPQMRPLGTPYSELPQETPIPKFQSPTMGPPSSIPSIPVPERLPDAGSDLERLFRPVTNLRKAQSEIPFSSPIGPNMPGEVFGATPQQWGEFGKTVGPYITPAITKAVQGKWGEITPIDVMWDLGIILTAGTALPATPAIRSAMGALRDVSFMGAMGGMTEESFKEYGVSGQTVVSAAFTVLSALALKGELGKLLQTSQGQAVKKAVGAQEGFVRLGGTPESLPPGELPKGPIKPLKPEDFNKAPVISKKFNKAPAPPEPTIGGTPPIEPKTLVRAGGDEPHRNLLRELTLGDNAVALRDEVEIFRTSQRAKMAEKASEIREGLLADARLRWSRGEIGTAEYNRLSQEAFAKAWKPFEGKLADAEVFSTAIASETEKWARDEILKVFDDHFARSNATRVLNKALSGATLNAKPGIKGGSEYKVMQKLLGVEETVVDGRKVIVGDRVAEYELLTGKTNPKEVIKRKLIERKALTGVEPNPPEFAVFPKEKPGVDPNQGALGLPDKPPPPDQFPLSQYSFEQGQQFPSTATNKITFEPTGNLPMNLKGEQLGANLAELPTTPMKLGPKTVGQELATARFARAHDLPPEFVEAATKVLGEPTMWPVGTHAVVNALKEAGYTVVDIGNALRAMKASGDLSFWRQAAPLTVNNLSSFLKGNIAGVRAVKSGRFAEEAMAAIQRDPLYAIYKQGPDFMRPLIGGEEFGYMTIERFIPRMVNKIPFVKLSQRGFVTAINEMTWDIYKKHYAKMMEISKKIESGKIKNPPGGFDVTQQMHEYASMLADMSGRAVLPKIAQGSAKALSATVFAPRHSLGRILTPRHLFSPNPIIRKEAFNNLATFVGANGAVIMAGYEMGLWDIELDPRSSNAYKIRMGNTWIDPWGGYQQLVRVVAQGLTFRKKDARGQLVGTNPWDALMQFGKSKRAPIVGIAEEVFAHKVYSGKPVDPKDWKFWIEHISPMAWQDSLDAWQMQGPASGLGALVVAGTGIGVMTYEAQYDEWLKKYPEAQRLDAPYGKVSKTITTPFGEKRELSEKERNELQQMTNDKADSKLSILFDSTAYKGGNDKRKTELIQYQLNKAREEARYVFIRQLISTTSQPSTSQPSTSQPSTSQPSVSPQLAPSGKEIFVPPD